MSQLGSSIFSQGRENRENILHYPFGDVESFLGFRKFSQKFRKFSKILASMGSVKVEKIFKFLENFLKREKKGRKSPMGMRPI